MQSISYHITPYEHSVPLYSNFINLSHPRRRVIRIIALQFAVAVEMLIKEKKRKKIKYYCAFGIQIVWCIYILHAQICWQDIRCGYEHFVIHINLRFWVVDMKYSGPWSSRVAKQYMIHSVCCNENVLISSHVLNFSTILVRSFFICLFAAFNC